MPFLATILSTLIHLCFSVGVNWFLKELGLISGSEFVALYFIVLAAKRYDDQLKFADAYAQNPDLMEAMLRHQLNEEEQD